MKYLILIFVASLSICSFGQDNEISKTDLHGCWTDSREENTQNSDIKFYRPCDFKSFPASRFRFRMDLKEDGRCSWLYLAPNDAHQMEEGTWDFDEKTMILNIFNSNDEEVKSFVIRAIGENILKTEN